MTLPFMKFWTQAWRSDPQLRMCSPAARGLWIDLICLMHEAQPTGHLLVNGIKPTVGDLSRLCAITPDECQICLDELIRNGVCSVLRNGVIVSRKMIRDEAAARKKRQNGALGGNPALRSGGDKSEINRRYSGYIEAETPEIADAVNHGKSTNIEPPDNHDDNQDDKQVVSHRSQKSEVRSQKEDDDERARAGARSFFDQVLVAAGLNPADMRQARWMPPGAEVEVNRWLQIAPGVLTEDLIIAHIAASRVAHHGEPPAGPKAFERGLRQLAGTLAAPPPQPIDNPFAGNRVNGHGPPPRRELSREKFAEALKGRPDEHEA